MNKEKSVWRDETTFRQLEEEREDYQYFRRYDRRELRKTLNSALQNGHILTES